jgi:hypothetical protein
MTCIKDKENESIFCGRAAYRVKRRIIIAFLLIAGVLLSGGMAEALAGDCARGRILLACDCKDPQTEQLQVYTSGYCFNGYWHDKSWEEFVIWEDSFDDGIAMSAKYFEYDDDEGDFIPVTYEHHSPPYSLRAKYQSGEVSAGGFKKSFGRTPSSYIGKHAAHPNEDFREIYWRFYLKMQAGWEGYPAKVCRATIMAKADWSQAMIAHLWSGSNSPYLVLDPASGVDVRGNLVTQGYNDFSHLKWLGIKRGVSAIFSAEESGRWRCIEAHVKLDDPGKNNGVFEFWVDGNLEARSTGLAWVKTWDDYGINCLFFANYWNNGSPKEQERYFDDLVIATERIGPQRTQNGQDSSKEDLNEDGEVNVIDVQLCVNVVLGTEKEPTIFERADVNEDGNLDVIDVQQIVNSVLEV